MQEIIASGPQRSEKVRMARPQPAPENVPVRTTVSLPKKLTAAGERYRSEHPDEEISDFSMLLRRALRDYLDKKHPGLIEEVARELRSDYAQPPKKLQLVADPKARPKKKSAPPPYPEDGPVIGPHVLDEFVPQAGSALPPTHSPRKSKPTPAAPR
jgi:hypothetical protein